MRFPDGRETTVSVKDLAPCGEVREPPLQESERVVMAEPPALEQGTDGGEDHPDEVEIQGDTGVKDNEPIPVRRSTRNIKPPERLITQV